MDTIAITNLVMDDLCKNENDLYQLAFYDIKNFEIEKKVCLNVQENDCNKFRINNFDWLKKQDILSMPDVLVMRPTTKLTQDQMDFLLNSKIKVYYVDENILSNDDVFNRSLNDIERLMYKSKTLKYVEIEKKQILDIEEKYNKSNNEEIANSLINELLNLIKQKDETTYSHVKNVSDYVDIFVDGMPDDKKLNEEQISFLKRAALVHDIGKLTIPNQILKKGESLTNNEYHDMKKHVDETAYLFNNKVMEDYKDIALSHHERYDGKGYPNKLKGEEIPYYARIISVLDTFEALTGKREYVKKQKSRSLYDVLNILKENAGTQFDPEIVKYFILGVIKNPEFQESLSEEKGGILKCS